MFYQGDFKQPPFQPRFDYGRSIGQLRKTKRVRNRLEPDIIIKHDSDDEDDGENKSFVAKWFCNFCENTSIHGVKYLGLVDLHWTERYEWLFGSV